MQKAKYQPVFNRANILPGDIACRQAYAPFSQMIRIRTSGIWNTIRGTSWSHDGIVVVHNGCHYIGDALMGTRATLTPMLDWETGCIEGAFKTLFLRPIAAEPWQGEAAAWYWQTNILGQPYDNEGIYNLAFRFLADMFKHKVGNESHFWCTEGCQTAWKEASGIDPWAPKINSTPGTTRKRFLQGRFMEVENSFTQFGEQFRIPIDI